MLLSIVHFLQKDNKNLLMTYKLSGDGMFDNDLWIVIQPQC